jgi:hypothetical protein
MKGWLTVLRHPILWWRLYKVIRSADKFLKVVVLAIGLTVSSSAYAEWQTHNTVMEVGFGSLLLVDMLQTDYHAKHQPVNQYNLKMVEGNPILGLTPSTTKLVMYNTSVMLIHMAVAYYIPDPYKDIFQSCTIGVEVACIFNNYNSYVGIGGSYNF